MIRKRKECQKIETESSFWEIFCYLYFLSINSNVSIFKILLLVSILNNLGKCKFYDYIKTIIFVRVILFFNIKKKFLYP